MSHARTSGRSSWLWVGVGLRWAALALSPLLGAACKSSDGTGASRSAMGGGGTSNAPSASGVGGGGGSSNGPSESDAGGGDRNVDAGRVVPGDCSGSSISMERLDAARGALAAGGAVTVDLSGDGCIVLRRTIAGDEISDEVAYGDTVGSRWRHAPGTTSGDVDDDGDGSFDLHVEIEEGESEPSRMVVSKLDPGGSVVRRETSTLQPDGTNVRVVVEVGDGTGNLSTEIEFDAPRVQGQVVTGPATGTGAGACNESQSQILELAMREALAQGLDCARRTGWRGLETHFARVLPARGVELRCAESEGFCANIDFWSTVTGRLRLGSSIGVLVNPELAFEDAACGDLTETLLHEIMHSFLGLHLANTDFSTPAAKLADRTYACAAMCGGGPATRCECASCLGTDVCDPRCASFPECERPAEQGAVCTCPSRRRGYATPIDCASDCSSGLLCFAADCRALDFSCSDD